MRRIGLKKAKATLSKLVDDASLEHPSLITRPGQPQAVVLSCAEWQKLGHVPSLGVLLGAAPPFVDERNETPARDVLS